MVSENWSYKQKFNKERLAWYKWHTRPDGLNTLYRTFDAKAKEYTFFLSALLKFYRLDHMLGHRTSLYEFHKFEIT